MVLIGKMSDIYDGGACIFPWFPKILTIHVPNSRSHSCHVPCGTAQSLNMLGNEGVKSGSLSGIPFKLDVNKKGHPLDITYHHLIGVENTQIHRFR